MARARVVGGGWGLRPVGGLTGGRAGAVLSREWLVAGSGVWVSGQSNATKQGRWKLQGFEGGCWKQYDCPSQTRDPFRSNLQSARHQPAGIARTSPRHVTVGDLIGVRLNCGGVGGGVQFDGGVLVVANFFGSGKHKAYWTNVCD